jgi:hypothetical protein
MPHTFSSGQHLAEADSASGRYPARHVTLLLVALLAFIAGLIVGSSNGSAPSGSRIAWPPSESLKPHPRTIQP